MKIGRLSRGHILAARLRKVVISFVLALGILGVWVLELAQSRYIWSDCQDF